MKAKVTVHEDSHGKLTNDEIKEAERLMKSTGELKLADRHITQGRRAAFKELQKIIENADIVLQILDARDPQACRSQETEK